MARFSGGYFPVPRAWYVEDPVINPFFKYKAARDLMVLLLQWAAVQETELCQRGQVVTSWEELGGALGVSVSAARRRQAILQKVKKADRKGDRYGLLITVIDYEAYYEVGQAADRKADKNPTGSRHLMEERKKERKTLSPHGEALAALWSEHRGRLPAIHKLTKERAVKAEARWAENPDPAFWEAVIKRLAASDFAATRSWATFDWLVKNAGNPLKVSEGNYDNRSPSEGAVGKNPETAKFRRH